MVFYCTCLLPLLLLLLAGAQARKLLSEQKLQATAAATAEHHTAVHATRHTAREANAQLLAMAVAAPPAAADVPAAAQANVHAGGNCHKARSQLPSTLSLALNV